MSAPLSLSSAGGEEEGEKGEKGMPFRPLHTVVGASVGHRILLSTIVCMAGRWRGGGGAERKGQNSPPPFRCYNKRIWDRNQPAQQRLTAMNWSLRFDTIAGREEKEEEKCSLRCCTKWCFRIYVRRICFKGEGGGMRGRRMHIIKIYYPCCWSLPPSRLGCKWT